MVSFNCCDSDRRIRRAVRLQGSNHCKYRARTWDSDKMNATISLVNEGSPAHQAGLEKGDVLVEINGNPVRDVIDYMFHCRDSGLNLKVRRGGRSLAFRIKKKERTGPGIEFKPFKIKTCGNKCVFCFVDQLPKGMRKTLYLKDDDYRMSFLYGSYITLSKLLPAERKRIIEQRLRPLYVSVHTTNNDLRRKMLGNPGAPDILEEMKGLISHRIKVHTQIVLCQGLNDGDELLNTIKDLHKLYPYVASIAVVPVGLTRYGKGNVKPVGKSDAVKVIETVKQIRRRFRKRHGDPIVYLADEFYIKADLPFPSLKGYGDLPQLENGVGMVPLFLNSAKKLRLPKKMDARHVVVFTGAAFMPYLKELAERLRTIEGLTLDIIKVDNRFFGPSVTVAGLLTGKDILKAMVGRSKADCLLVPDVALKNGEDIFLDNVT
ncbi:MAG TPA: DUF512 domain-containing protein, partial [Nitrospirae bacterium]|nr:DUF512 domain-containing protein [Nitrospirota bacterium]